MIQKKLTSIFLCTFLGLGACCSPVPTIYANTITDANDWGTNGNGTNETTDSNNNTLGQMHDPAENDTAGQTESDNQENSLQLSENSRNEQQGDKIVRYVPGQTNLKDLDSLKGVRFSVGLNDMRTLASDSDLFRQFQDDVYDIAYENDQDVYTAFQQMVMQGADTPWWDDPDVKNALANLLAAQGDSLNEEASKSKIIVASLPEPEKEVIDVTPTFTNDTTEKDNCDSRTRQIIDILANNKSLVGALLDIRDSKDNPDFSEADRSKAGKVANDKTLVEALSTLSNSSSDNEDKGPASEKTVAGAIASLIGNNQNESNNDSNTNDNNSSGSSGFSDFLQRESVFGGNDNKNNSDDPKSLFGESGTALGEKSLFDAIMHRDTSNGDVDGDGDDSDD